MSSANHHLDHGRHNIAFLKTFYKGCQYNDWSVTVGFYSLVHLVEFAVARFGKVHFLGHEIELMHTDQLPAAAKKAKIAPPFGYDFETHSQHKLRNMLISGSDEFKEVRDRYLLFYDNSRISRYKQHAWQKFQVDLLFETAFKPTTKWMRKTFGISIDSI